MALRKSRPSSRTATRKPPRAKRESPPRSRSTGLPPDELAALLAAVAGSTLEAILVFDESLRLVYANQAAAALFGWELAAMAGAPLEAFVPERLRERHREAVREFAEGARAPGSHDELVSVVGLRADGSEVALEAAISVATLSGCRYYSVLHRDLERRRADERATLERRHVETRLENLASVAPGVMFSYEIDPGGRSGFTYLSDGIREITGRGPREFIDDPELPFAVVHPDDVAALVAERVTALEREGPWRAEFRVRGRDGTWVWLEGTSAPAPRAQGGALVFHGFLTEIGERKRAEAALAEKRELQDRLARLSRIAPGVMFTYEARRDGFRGLTFVSEGIRDLSGRTAAELLEEPGGFLGLIHPDDLERFATELEAALSGPRAWHSEFRARAANDEWVWLEGRSTPEPPLPSGDLVFHGFLAEIGERKRAEVSLAASERRYRGLFESMLEGYAYCRMVFENGRPVDFVYLDVNPAFERLTGLTQVIGRAVSEVIPGIQRDNPELFETYGRVAKTGEPARLDTFVPALGIWFQLSVFRPEPDCFVAVFQNVTEAKRTEEALRESLASYSTLVETSPDAIFVRHGDEIALANPAFLELIGAASADQVVGRSPFDFIHPDDHAEVKRRVRSMFESGSQAPRTEVRFIRLDGEVVDVESVAALLLFDGSPAIQVVLRDIRMRKRAEKALRESERFTRSILNGLASHIAVIDGDGAILAVNTAWRAFAAANGLDSRLPCCENANYLEVCDRAAANGDGSAGQFAAGLRAVLADELPRYEQEYACHGPDERRWFLARITPFSEGGPRRAVVSHENITDRVLGEESLRDSQRALFHAQAIGKVGSWTADLIAGTFDASPEGSRLVGWQTGLHSADEIPEFIHPEDRALQREAWTAALEGRAPFDLEHRVVVDGETRWIHVKAEIDRDPAGRPLRATGITQDITERRRTEEALRRQESLLRDAGDMAHVGGWEFDPATGQGSWTEETAKIHDLDPTVPPNVGMGLSHYAEASRPQIAAAVEAATRDGKPYDLELELVSATGTRKWVRTIGHPETVDGKVVKVRGSIQDVTERKRVEEELAAERTRLRTVLDTLPDPVWLKDPRGIYLACNPAFERMMGSSQAEIVGRSDLDLLPADRAEFFRGRDRMAIEAGGPVRNEEWIDFAADGHRAILETIKTPLWDARGELVGVLGIAREVTDLRKAAEALRASEVRLRLFIEHAPAALAMLDREMRYLAASRRWRADYGLGDGDLAGRSHYELFPELGEEWKAIHRRALDGEVIRSEEDRFERLDGTVQWLRWEVRPWHAVGGEIGGLVIFSEDVTASKVAAVALAQSEAHYRALAETTFDWIWEVDDRARYTFVSPRVTEILGFAPEEVLGKTPFHLMPDDEAERVMRIYADLAARRVPFEALENVNQHRDGRLVTLESSGVPFFGPDGEFRGYRGMDRDITARKAAERRSATQAAVSRALAEARTLAEAAPRVLEAIGSSEGWDFGALWEVTADEERMRAVEHWRSEAVVSEEIVVATRALRMAPGEGLAGSVWLRKLPILIPDLALDPSFLRKEAVRVAGLRSGIGFPIFAGERVLGVVDFLGRTVHEPEAGLLEMFETLGRQLGQFVERRRAEEAVERFVAGSPAVIYALRVEPEGLRLAWHGGNLETISGWSGDEIDGDAWWRDNIHPDDRERVLAANAVPYEVDHQVLEFRFRRPDESYFWVRDEKRLLRDAAGKPREIVGSWTDVTERVQLEEQLRVSQKLEAVGRLAGGVAHDFNNILTIITGNGEVLARSLPASSTEQVLVGEIRDAAARAAGLTRQLLAFSRSQVLAPQVLELNAVVERVEGMLRRLIGEDVALTHALAPEAGHVRVDPGQLEQVIVNLAVNARDAMPRGGRLTIESHAVELDAEYCRRHADAAPGRYAQLALSDTGLGMSPEVMARIFEPFFTTKGPGKGSGLGLATVFGIVKQSGGLIEVYSEAGQGTSFKIYLPQVAETAASEVPTAPLAPTRGSETVLLVEDEEGVRKIARLALESHGYRVLTAADGRAAVAIAEEQGAAIDLLVTDLVMPEMSGRELADLLRSRRAGLKVLFMSGYVEDAIVRHGLVEEEEAFLHKPFALAELAAKVRSVLDGLSHPDDDGSGAG